MKPSRSYLESPQTRSATVTADMLVVITPYRELGAPVRARRLLRATVASVDAQATEVLHCIVDDGNSKECSSYLESAYSGPSRIILHRSKQPAEVLGCPPALNFAFDHILDGKLSRSIPEDSMVTALHADDLALSFDQRVAACGSTASFCYSDAALLIEGSREILSWPSLRFPLRHTRALFWMLGRFAYPTMTWRLGFLNLLREYNAVAYGHKTVMDSRVGCAEDVDLCLASLECAVAHGAEVAAPKAVTAVYRIRDDSLSEIRDPGERWREERFILRKHFGAASSLLRAGRVVVRPETVWPGLLKARLLFRRGVDDEIADVIRLFEMAASDDS